MAVEWQDWELALLGSEPVARLGTITADGRPHLVPVCFVLHDDALFIAVDEKPKRDANLARLRNIERDSRATLLVDHYEADWTWLAWVRVEGRAEVLARGDLAPAVLAALRERYRPYREMSLESLPLIRLTPERVVSWRSSVS